MKKNWTKRAALFSLICLILGGSLMFLGYSLGGRSGVWVDRNGMHSNRESQEQKEVSMPKTKLEPLQSVVLDVRQSDVTFLPSEDDSWYLEYKMKLPVKSRNPSYELRDGCLTFWMEEEDGSEDVMGFFMVTTDVWPKGYVKLYVPAGAQLDEVRLSNSDGNSKIAGITADLVEIESGYGKAVLENISAGKLLVSLSDGDLKCSEIEVDNADIHNAYGQTSLSRFTVSESMKVNSSDGKIHLSHISAGGLDLENAYGGLDGDDVKAKEMKLQMSDGNCRLTQLDIMTGDIDQKYGNVELHLKGRQEDYNYNLETRYGSIELNGEKVEKSEPDGEHSNYQVTQDGARSLTARSSDGKLVIQTEQ